MTEDENNCSQIAALNDRFHAFFGILSPDIPGRTLATEIRALAPDDQPRS